MRKNNQFFIYTFMWIAAVIILMILLIHNVGDARIVNYSGIVRGATQKLVKEEINGQKDDELILELDNIINNLQTGKGNFNLHRNNSKDYQKKLNQLDHIWHLIKREIYKFRKGETSSDTLYKLSQKHFVEANQMVSLAEQSSERKLIYFIIIYANILLISIVIFTILNHKNHKELEHSIYTDNLTGILNRAGFEAAAASLLVQNPENKYCLIEFDIDDFKFLNNNYGFELGNKLLCALASCLQNTYHTKQLCAHISADNFVVLSINDSQIIDKLHNLLLLTLHQETFINICEFVSFTFGGYEISENNEAIQSIMDKASIAHKNAKVLEKSIITWYNEKFLEKLNNENKLKNRMHYALNNNEFKMYLQPKYTLSDLKIQSAEALVRWDIPNYGIVAPDNFIPLFEKNGYISEIDFHMLKKACDYIRKHIDTYGEELLIAVNFSRVTIYNQKFFQTIIEIVDSFAVPHHCIEIEITESAFDEISDLIIKKILSLQEIGFIISIDDFGSGYSSLNLLNKLPIQILKLDREFLQEYGVTEKTKNIIKCIIELAHTLDIKVICEGIEKQEHVDFLQNIGCDYGQGFYFSRPIPQEEFSLMYTEKTL